MTNHDHDLQLEGLTNHNNDLQSAETDIVEFDENDISNYTWKDKPYYKLDQRKLYKNKLCVRCVCVKIAEKETTSRNVKNIRMYPDVEML